MELREESYTGTLSWNLDVKAIFTIWKKTGVASLEDSVIFRSVPQWKCELQQKYSGLVKY